MILRHNSNLFYRIYRITKGLHWHIFFSLKGFFYKQAILIDKFLGVEGQIKSFRGPHLLCMPDLKGRTYMTSRPLRWSKILWILYMSRISKKCKVGQRGWAGYKNYPKLRDVISWLPISHKKYDNFIKSW